MTERKALFLDPASGLVTETGDTNPLDPATVPWLEELILDTARCKLALQFLGVNPEQFDVEGVL